MKPPARVNISKIVTDLTSGPVEAEPKRPTVELGREVQVTAPVGMADEAASFR